MRKNIKLSKLAHLYNTGSNLYTYGTGSPVAMTADWIDNIANYDFDNIKNDAKRGIWDYADPMFYITQGRHSDVGTGLGDLGVSLTSSGLTSGNPWLALAGAGFKVAGDIVDTTFGLKETNVDNVKNTIGNLGNFTSLASTYNQIVTPDIGYTPTGSNYEGGIFSKNKAKKLNKQLVSDYNKAYDWATRSVTNNISNIASDTMNKFNRSWYNNGGAIDFMFNLDLLNTTRLNAINKGKMNSLPNSFMTDIFADGGNIHIKEKNRGKFTQNAKRAGMGVQEFASHILANKEDYSPLMRKRANFAKNATKFKHDFGGDLFTNGAVFSNGSTWIGNGNHHSENPYEGVQIGVSTDGIPNLVELNEFIWREAPDGEYVFAGDNDGKNIMKVPKELILKYHLKKDITFAEAAKQLSKYSEERPNDPIAKAGMTAQLTELMNAQEEIRMANLAKEIKKEMKNLDNVQFAEGGLFGTKYEGVGSQSNNIRSSYTSPYQYITTGLRTPQYEAVISGTHLAEILNKILTTGLRTPQLGISLDEALIRGTRLAKILNKIGRANRGILEGSAPSESAWLFNPEHLNRFEIAKIFRNNPDLTDSELIKQYAPSMLDFYNNYIDSNNSQNNQSVINNLVTEQLPNLPIANNTELYIPYLNAYKKQRLTPINLLSQKDYSLLFSDINIPNQEKLQTKGSPVVANNTVVKATNIPSTVDEEKKEDDDDSIKDKNVKPIKDEDVKTRKNWLRYAPIAGSAISSAFALMEKPDYEYADKIEKFASIPPKKIGVSPLGDYITYNPFDRNYYLNKLQSDAAANRRQIINLSGGNRAQAIAGLLASDYNTINAIGNLTRQSEEYNQAQKERVAAFNRATNQFNAEEQLRAELANQQAYEDALRLGLTSIGTAAQIRDAEKARIAQNRNTNLTNLFDNLGALGRENYFRNQANANKVLLFADDGTGNSYYKGSCGGKITKKSKNRRT